MLQPEQEPEQNMDLDAFLHSIINSTAADWVVVPGHVLSYFECWESSAGSAEVKPIYYSTVHRLRSDLAITLAIGGESDVGRGKPREDWITQHPYPDAASEWTTVVLRYGGEAVREHLFVYLDGHRILVPAPRATVVGTTRTYTLPREDQALGRLVWDLHTGDPNRSSEFDCTGSA